MRETWINVAGLCATCALTTACGGGGTSSSPTPWEADQTTVVTPTGESITFATPADGECVEVPEFGCVEVPEAAACEAGSAVDVVLDDQGNVLDTVCLPPDAVSITSEEFADGEIPQDANQIAVDLSDVTYEDDLTVDANGIVLYGEDPDSAVIEGSLDIQGNNATVRGVTVDGDTSVAFNNATFVFCRIVGDVTIAGNNTLISGCEIFGNVTITGNNTVLNGNLIGGTLTVEGKNLDCSGEANRAFTDENEDGVVDEDEIGDEVGC